MHHRTVGANRLWFQDFIVYDIRCLALFQNFIVYDIRRPNTSLNKLIKYNAAGMTYPSTSTDYTWFFRKSGQCSRNKLVGANRSASWLRTIEMQNALLHNDFLSFLLQPEDFNTSECYSLRSYSTILDWFESGWITPFFVRLLTGGETSTEQRARTQSLLTSYGACSTKTKLYYLSEDQSGSPKNRSFPEGTLFYDEEYDAMDLYI